jgi:hypothetical protein
MLRGIVAQLRGYAVERPGRYTMAAVSGVLFVVVLLVGLYVAPDLVYPEEQVGGVSGSFYVNYESRLLAQAVLFGVASVLFLFFLGGLRAFLARAEGQEPRLAPVVLAAGAVFAALGLLQAATLTALVALRGNELGVRAQGKRVGGPSAVLSGGGDWGYGPVPVCRVPGRRRDGVGSHSGVAGLAGLDRGRPRARCWPAGRWVDRRIGYRTGRPGDLGAGPGLGGGARHLP